MKGTIWFTGLSCSGKTTLAKTVYDLLYEYQKPILIDGDELRSGLSSDLGFDKSSRSEQVRRAGEIALLISQQGFLSLCALISPYEKDRSNVRKIHENKKIPFIEIYVSTPLDICKKRDTKKIYFKNPPLLTGVSDIYEKPSHPDLEISNLRKDEILLNSFKIIDLAIKKGF